MKIMDDKKKYSYLDLNIDNVLIRRCILKWMNICYDLQNLSSLRTTTKNYLKKEVFAYWDEDFCVELEEILVSKQRNLFPDFCSAGTTMYITEQYILNIISKFKKDEAGLREWLGKY